MSIIFIKYSLLKKNF